MSRRVVGPFNRVEGDLEVQLDIAGGRVTDARVVSPLYRGFEQMLHGKDPRDALVYTPRICGICSVSQSVAAAAALAAAQGITPPPNGRLATNIALAAENLADHLTHFYLFFMPDFAREVYAGEPWHGAAAERFTALRGSAAEPVLRARRELLHVTGILLGKWPHSLALQPGGTTRPVEPQEKVRLLAILHGFRRFLEETLFAAPLEAIAALAGPDDLNAWRDAAPPQRGDLRHFLHLADALELDRLGRAGDRFMSHGAYDVQGCTNAAGEGMPRSGHVQGCTNAAGEGMPRSGDVQGCTKAAGAGMPRSGAQEAGGTLFARGLWHAGERHPLDTAHVREDVSHSWLFHGEPRHPFEGVTRPDPTPNDGYTWCKAPRLDGAVVEVGALARQLVDGHPLIRGLAAESGGNVRNRVVARLLELARVVPAMEQWTRALRPGEPFCANAPLPNEAQGAGLVEAARGSLGHWLRIRNGRILNYQVIAPTTWNFSPRDAAGTPGPLEQALVGAPVREGESDPVAVQHIVRSFDPCMVCTVH